MTTKEALNAKEKASKLFKKLVLFFVDGSCQHVSVDAVNSFLDLAELTIEKMTKPKDLVDIYFVADIFKVSTTMVYKHVASGLLPKPKKIGRKSFWKIDDVLLAERNLNLIEKSKAKNVQQL